jgi:hypothetical protein
VFLGNALVLATIRFLIIPDFHPDLG